MRQPTAGSGQRGVGRRVVAAVPGGVFPGRRVFRGRVHEGAPFVRFAFCKKQEVPTGAVRRLKGAPAQ